MHPALKASLASLVCILSYRLDTLSTPPVTRYTEADVRNIAAITLPYGDRNLSNSTVWHHPYFNKNASLLGTVQRIKNKTVLRLEYLGTPLYYQVCIAVEFVGYRLSSGNSI